MAASAGVDRVRITGGEPLVRSEIHKLIAMIRDVDGITDIAITTNAILLQEHAQSLRDAGLDRLNISLDTLNPKVFEQIARRKGLEKVLRGIDRAKEVGFKDIRLNTVALAGITETEIVPLATFARANNLTLRFIEFMPLDGDEAWHCDQVINGEIIRAIISSNVCDLLRQRRRRFAANPLSIFPTRTGRAVLDSSIPLLHHFAEPAIGFESRQMGV